MSQVDNTINHAGFALNDLTERIGERIRSFVAETHRYHIQDRWHVNGDVADVANLFLDSDRLSKWWPQFKQVDVLSPGDQHALGRVVRVLGKGCLPYSVAFQFKITDVSYPGYFRLEATGDFQGHGSGRLRQTKDGVVINFDWKIEVRKPFFRATSFLLRPLFALNHSWIMGRGQRRLASQIATS